MDRRTQNQGQHFFAVRTVHVVDHPGATSLHGALWREGCIALGVRMLRIAA